MADISDCFTYVHSKVCIDFQATARLCKQPLHDLVSYLTQDERTKTDVGKARAIYRWIAAQHVSTLPQDTAADTPGCAYR